MTGRPPADRGSPSAVLARVREALAEGKLLERAGSSLKSRGTRLAWRAYTAARGPHTLTFRVGGTDLAVDSRSHLAFPLWAGLFERESLDYVLATTRPGDVFIDIGANVGLYTLPVARAVGPTGHVYAFEPCPPTARRLRENLARNALENVDVVALAAHDTAGTATFHVFPEGMDVYNSLGAARRPEGLSSESIQVETVPLDRFCEERGLARVALLKADVEGAEELVIRGARRLLRESPDLRLILELYAPSADQCGCRVEALVGLVTELGYAPHLPADGGRLVPVTAAELCERAQALAVNAVFVRPAGAKASP